MNKNLGDFMYKILIVEDEIDITSTLKSQIEKYGYECHIVKKFEKVIDVFQELEPHLIIIDINLPASDGYYWLRKIRQVSTCPIMIMFDQMSEIDQIHAIEDGADNFITKPFILNVVLAKINSLIRRNYGEYAKEEESRILRKGNTTLKLDTVCLSTEKKEEMLTVKELRLCRMLFENFSHVVTREQLLSALWDEKEFVEENTLTVNIKRLWKKLESVNSSLEVKTIRGIGYQLIEKSNEVIF